MNGMRNGNGTFVFEDNTLYIGTWKDNNPCGLGLFYYNDGKYDTGIYSVSLVICYRMDC